MSDKRKKSKSDGGGGGRTKTLPGEAKKYPTVPFRENNNFSSGLQTSNSFISRAKTNFTYLNNKIMVLYSRKTERYFS
jgi:hypothetical protein